MIPPKQVPKPVSDNENCEIEIKKTRSGKIVRFKGKCSQSQLELLKQDNGIE